MKKMRQVGFCQIYNMAEVKSINFFASFHFANSCLRKSTGYQQNNCITGVVSFWFLKFYEAKFGLFKNFGS